MQVKALSLSNLVVEERFCCCHFVVGKEGKMFMEA